MATLACLNCRQYTSLTSDGRCDHCSSPAGRWCTRCGNRATGGEKTCRVCDPAPVLERSRATAAGSAAMVIPEPTPLHATVVPVVAPVVERYRGGSHGVEAEITMPARDVEILNDLARLVPVLHQVASRAATFTGLTDATRKMIRDMRVLASDVQAEIETRRGPG